MARHLLILIHGITPERQPDVTKQYQRLLSKMRKAGLTFHGTCQVRWGVAAADGSMTRPDEFLTKAENFVGELLEESARKAKWSWDWGTPLRPLIGLIRQTVVQYGLSDALYYAAPEGERAVRDTVFDQVFGKLEATQDGETHLHIVAHSLGVTVAHDFLYALFGRKHDPDFPKQPDAVDPYRLDAATRALQEKWRDEAEAGRLKLGTFISFASQLPLFVMRKQALVERLAREQKLDPAVIGIDKTRKSVQWAIFWDSDELLGFPTRALYEDGVDAIVDVRMNSGIGPLGAHLGYWRKRKILNQCVELLEANLVP